MALTEHRDYPLPDETKTVKEELETLRDLTLPKIDADMHAVVQGLANKANSDHGHAISDVTGLPAALDGKMPASQTFALEDLDDVSGADAAPDGYVLVKVGDEWVAQSAAAAMGDHDHTMTQVVGLADALAARAPLNSPALTGAPTAPTAAPGSDTQQLANTAFVAAAITGIKGGVSSAYDTLAKLASGITDVIARVAALEAIGKPFTQEYVSAESALVAGGTSTFTHGLGVRPKNVTVELICKVADYGFSVGDVIEVGATAWFLSGVNWYGFTIEKTPSTVKFLMPFGIYAARKDVPTQTVVLTSSRWNMIVRAWA